MASIDRQALLEQKRKRLQELKERRAGVSTIDAASPNLTLAEPVAPRAKVDFAVQVDLAQSTKTQQLETGQAKTESTKTSGHTAPTTDDKQIASQIDEQAPSRPSVKFEKIVQTDFERFVDLTDILKKDAPSSPGSVTANEKSKEQKSPPDHSPDLEVNAPESKVGSALSDFLSDAGFQFSDLRLGLKQEEAIDSELVAPFNVTKGVAQFINRPIVALASTPDHPHVFLAAYGNAQPSIGSGKRASVASAGLAVLFNKASSTIIPEFFLQCTSEIRTIMFDKSNAFKVFAGLENGRVAMWDLAKVEPTRVAVLPTLQTSTVASASLKSQHRFIHHVAPIIFLAQINTESAQSSGVLSICEDGVVNLWSPNFFAFPKVTSVKLADEDIGHRIPFKLTDALIMSTIVRVHTQTGHQNPPELNFLNSTVVASRNGSIYKLANMKDKAFIRSKLVDTTEATRYSAREAKSIIEIQHKAATLLLSAHSDWSLKLWDLEAGKLIHVVSTSTLVSKIVARPGHPTEFITIGTVRPPKIGLFVKFWDLKAKLLGPISTIPTREKQSGTVLFSADGSEMILAYDDGELDVFTIEESNLVSQVQSRSHKSVDEGLDRLLSSL